MQNSAFIKPLKTSVLIILLSMLNAAYAEDERHMNTITQKQDLALLKMQVEDFLKMETNGYPGDVTVNGVSIDRNLKLAQCPDPTFSLASGIRAWAKTSVAVSCTSPVKWTIYVQANISIVADYFIAAMPLAQGHTVTKEDLMKVRGDLTKLPAGIFTDVNQVIGRTVNISLMSGSLLRQEMLKMPIAVQQGQTVTLKTVGNGFQASTEAKALNTAVEGQPVQVKVSSGEVIAGVARAGGQVEVTF